MNNRIYSGEWKLMEYLWEASPRTLMEIVRAMAQRMGWAKSTVTTMVTRMEAKGLLRFEQEGRTTRIYPAVTRQEAAAQETDTLLDKAYNGSAGLLVSALIRQNKLSSQELDELYDLLRQAEQEERHD